MPRLFLFYLLSCAVFPFVAAEEIFRRELCPNSDLVLSLSPDESVRDLSFNILEEPLPFDAIHAAAIAIATQRKNKLPQHKPDEIQVESVELIRYDIHNKGDHHGKYFYFVVLRRYTHGNCLVGHSDAQPSMLLSYWAIFTNGNIKAVKHEDK